MDKLYINGKFMAQPTTGVQRFARQILVALDELLTLGANACDNDIVLVVPKTVATEAIPRLRRIQVHRLVSGRSLHAWEQTRLPWRARDGILLNLSGSAPMLASNQVCTFHDAAVFDVPHAYSRNFVRWYRLLFHAQARRARYLLTVSRFSRERLCANLDVTPSRIGIVHNGADHLSAVVADEAVLQRLALEPGGYFLGVGSDNPAKNFDRLLSAHSALAGLVNQLPMVVVGGSNTAVFSVAARQADTAGIVRTGRVGDAELKALYANARAFVFPSLYEGFGIPPLEAMMCGCAVLAADAASVPEICGDGAAYFDPLSVDALRDLLHRALHDDDWLIRLRLSGQRRVASFTWAAAAQQLLRHLLKIGVLQSSTEPGGNRHAIAKL